MSRFNKVQTVVFCALILALMAIVIQPLKHASAAPRPRFELLLSEDAPGEEAAHFAVFHDKEAGNEVICYEHWTYGGGHAPACWLTGRKW